MCWWAWPVLIWLVAKSCLIQRLWVTSGETYVLAQLALGTVQYQGWCLNWVHLFFCFVIIFMTTYLNPHSDKLLISFMLIYFLRLCLDFLIWKVFLCLQILPNFLYSFLCNKYISYVSRCLKSSFMLKISCGTQQCNPANHQNQLLQGYPSLWAIQIS